MPPTPNVVTTAAAPYHITSKPSKKTSGGTMAVAVEERFYVVEHLRIEDKQFKLGKVSVKDNELQYVSNENTSITFLLNTVQVHGVRKQSEGALNLLYMQLEGADGILGFEASIVEGDSDNDEECNFIEVEIAFSDYEAAQSVFRSVADAIRAWDDSHANPVRSEDDEEEDDMDDFEKIQSMQQKAAFEMQEESGEQFEDAEE